MFWDSILPLTIALQFRRPQKPRSLYGSSASRIFDWVLANTVILHFCGRKKPWHKGYAKRFEVLYNITSTKPSAGFRSL
jgi:lipopolysaccharide biosynthesis glycosyltransferase